MKKKKLKLNGNQIYAINYLKVNKRIPYPSNCYLHGATVKFLIKHGIAKTVGNYLQLTKNFTK